MLNNQLTLPSGDLTWPWKITFFIGKPSISMDHLYHGYVSYNQRVYPISVRYFSLIIHIHTPSLQGDQMIIPKKINGILVAPARCFPMKSTNHGEKSHEPHRKKNPIVYKFGKCQIMSMLDIQKPWQKKWLLPKLVRHFSGTPSIKQYDEWLKKPPDGIRPPPGSQ